MGSPPGRYAADRWQPGDWNIDCSMCGFKMKAGEAVMNWQGTWRHVRCNEPRPAQDFVHAIRQPEMVVPYVQKQAEAFTQICTLNGISSIPGYAMPGCAIPGRKGPLMEVPPQFLPVILNLRLLETGDDRLLENGGFRLLEG